MLRSMYSGVSGLKAHQNQMDVIGNNIANVNTTGFKGSRVTFKEMLNQTISGASSPQDGRGGTNPKQIGLGVQLGSIDNNMGQGSLQSTGKMTDMAIQGEGFFILNDGKQYMYTRAGNMSFDEEGYLVNSSNGNRVQGWLAQEDGTINDTSMDNLEDITLDKTMDASASEEMILDGNIDASIENELKARSVDVGSGANTDRVSIDLSKTDNYNQWEFKLTAGSAGSSFDFDTGYITYDEEGNITEITENIDGTGQDFTTNPPQIDIDGDGTYDDSIDVGSATDYTSRAYKTFSTSIYDSLGIEHDLSIKAEKIADNTWQIDESDINLSGVDNTSISLSSGTEHVINFDNSNGRISSGEAVGITFDPIGGAASGQSINIDFSELTQFAGDMTADVNDVDGYSQGELKDFTLSDSGIIVGSYDNGYNKNLAQIGIAEFSNPAGLIKNGETMFSVSNNSGDPKIGSAGTGGKGLISSSTLEMSNVDLADQFTKMITSQRGFQANSKIITTSDEMLQGLVNIKR